MAETSLGPLDPERPDDPEPPNEPEPPEPEPPEGAIEWDAGVDEFDVALLVQATWPIPTPAASATTAAAPMMATTRPGWPAER
jgi:hypothetical protein